MKLLPLDNDYLVRFTITDEQTGAAPSPVITGLNVRVAATRDGAAIGALDISSSDTDSAGMTEGVLQGDALTTALAAAYKGRVVFAILYKSGGDIKAFIELKVIETRAAA